MDILNDEFVLFLKCAQQNGLRYMLIGGYAVASLYEEDFSVPFVGSFGSEGADIDVITVVHHAPSYYEAKKNKNVFEIYPVYS